MFPNTNLSQELQARALAQILLERERQRQHEKNQLLLAASLLLQQQQGSSSSGSQAQSPLATLNLGSAGATAHQDPRTQLLELAARMAAAPAPATVPQASSPPPLELPAAATTVAAPTSASTVVAHTLLPQVSQAQAPAPSSLTLESWMQALGYSTGASTSTNTTSATGTATSAGRAVSPSSSGSTSMPDMSPMAAATATATTSTATSGTTSPTGSMEGASAAAAAAAAPSSNPSASMFNMDFSGVGAAINAGMTSMDALSDEDYFSGAHRKTYLGERGTIIHVHGAGEDNTSGAGAIYKGEAFPMKLYRMLYETAKEGHEGIVGYSASGKAFHIHQPDAFTKDIMSKYFSTTRMSSFQRQLNLYGFRRLSHGVDKGGYHHPYFIQGERNLCKTQIKRKVPGATGPVASVPMSFGGVFPPPQVSSAPAAAAASAAPSPLNAHHQVSSAASSTAANVAAYNHNHHAAAAVAAPLPATVAATPDASALMPSLLALLKSELMKAQAVAGSTTTTSSPSLTGMSASVITGFKN